MAKWSKRTSAFKVKIAYDKQGRAKATIPAPIIAALDKPNVLTFELRQGEIIAKFDKELDIETVQARGNATP